MERCPPPSSASDIISIVTPTPGSHQISKAPDLARSGDNDVIESLKRRGRTIFELAPSSVKINHTHVIPGKIQPTSIEVDESQYIRHRSLPGSQTKKQIYYEAPVSSSHWTAEEYSERYGYVQEQLESKILSDKMLSEHSRDISFHLAMVGTTPRTAVPSVVVFCKNEHVRQLKNVFDAARHRLYCAKNSKAYRLFKTNPPPEPPFKLEYFRTDKAVNRKAAWQIISAELPPDGVLCGAPLCYQEARANIGITLRVGNRILSTTVDHLFSAQSDQAMDTAMDEDSDDDTVSVHSNDSNQHTLNDEDLITLDPLWIDDPDEENPKDLEPLTTVGLGLSTNMGPMNTTFKMPSMPSKRILGHKIDGLLELPSSACYRDFALVLLDNKTTEGLQPNTFTLPGSNNLCYRIERILDKPRFHGVPVYVLLGARGVRSGRLLANFAYLGSGPGRAMCKAWSLVFDGEELLEDGECGSVVVDQDTHEVYGHIIGSNPMNQAYVVPFIHIVEDIKLMFPTCDVSLAESAKVSGLCAGPCDHLPEDMSLKCESRKEPTNKSYVYQNGSLRQHKIDEQPTTSSEKHLEPRRGSAVNMNNQSPDVYSDYPSVHRRDISSGGSLPESRPSTSGNQCPTMSSSSSPCTTASAERHDLPDSNFPNSTQVWYCRKEPPYHEPQDKFSRDEESVNESWYCTTSKPPSSLQSHTNDFDIDLTSHSSVSTTPTTDNLASLIDSHTVRSAEPTANQTRPFLPISALRSILTEDNVKAELRRIRLPEGYTAEIFSRFKKVFAILVLIESIDRIQDFIDNELSDFSLPLTQKPHWWREGGHRHHMEPATTDSARTVNKIDCSTSYIQHQCTTCTHSFGPAAPWSRHEDQNIQSNLPSPLSWEAFKREQWKFCVPIFERDKHSDYESEMILPFVEKQELRKGSFGSLWKVRIHPDHHIFKAETTSNGHYPTTFALKTFHAGAGETMYQRERFAFETLRCDLENDSHVVKHLTTFRHGDTHNILLEYSEHGTLEDLWNTESPPQTSEDLLKFWASLFDIVQPLHRIHKLILRNGKPQQSYIHDLKPKNILVIPGRRKYDLTFKVADLDFTIWPNAVPDSHMILETGSDVDVVSMSFGRKFGAIFDEALTWTSQAKSNPMLHYSGKKKIKHRKSGRLLMDDVKALTQHLLDGTIDIPELFEWQQEISKDIDRELDVLMIKQPDHAIKRTSSRRAHSCRICSNFARNPVVDPNGPKETRSSRPSFLNPFRFLLSLPRNERPG